MTGSARYRHGEACSPPDDTSHAGGDAIPKRAELAVALVKQLAAVAVHLARTAADAADD